MVWDSIQIKTWISSNQFLILINNKSLCVIFVYFQISTWEAKQNDAKGAFFVVLEVAILK